MSGLIRNNFYATRLNMQSFSGIMLLLGVFVVAVDNAIPTLLIGYAMLSMVGFSFNAVAGLRKEQASKWGKYKLTAPVRRRDIVKSYFICQLVWLLVGVLFAAVCVGLSILLHGVPFERSTDIVMLFTAGISVSLLMCAIFFPLFHLGGEERNEVILIMSGLCAAGIFMGLVSLFNRFFGSNVTMPQLLLSAFFLLACALSAFCLSYPITSGIFSRKEY